MKAITQRLLQHPKSESRYTLGKHSSVLKRQNTSATKGLVSLVTLLWIFLT